MIATTTRDTLELRPACEAITWRGRSMRLSPTRYRLVSCLARGNGRFIDSRELAQLVLGEVTWSAQNNLRVVISNVRAHLPGLIETKKGWGYRLATDQVIGL